MSTGFLHAIPLVVVAVVVLLIYRPKGERPQTYRLSERWTHAPILWSAVDETVPGGGHGGHGHHVNVGGGASGRW